MTTVGPKYNHVYHYKWEAEGDLHKHREELDII